MIARFTNQVSGEPGAAQLLATASGMRVASAARSVAAPGSQFGGLVTKLSCSARRSSRSPIATSSAWLSRVAAVATVAPASALRSKPSNARPCCLATAA
jgi:hypothetical protein